MSNETTPLLPTHLQPSQEQIDQTVSSAKETAFSISLALGALRAGKLPTGDQLDKLLQAALDSDVLSLGVGRGSGRTGRLSEEGARVVKSLREVIEAVRVVGQEKNGDDKLQETIYSLSQVEAPSAPARGSRLDPATSSTIPSRREVESDGQKTLKSLQTILTLLVTSSEFRLVLNQVISLASSVLADGAHKVAENASELEKKAREAGSDDQPIDIESTKKKGKKAVKGLVSGRIQGEAREEVLNQFEGLSEYFEDKISGDDEAKDKLFEKLKDVVVSVQKDKKYGNAVDVLLSIIKKYGNKAEKLADAAVEHVDDEADQSALQEGLADTRTIIERFANGESLEPVINAVSNLKDDVTNDGEVKQFFTDLGKFIEASLKVEGYVVSQRAARRSNELWERGQKLSVENQKYREDIDQLTKSLESFATALSEDDSTAELGFALENFGIELTAAGKSGVNALRAESSGLYRDVIDVFVPRLIALVKEIPLPRMEFKSQDVDFVIDDLSIQSASFIPDSIRIIQHNDLSLVQGYAAYAADYDGSLRVRVDGLRFGAESISYWVDKKSGLVPFEDEGLLDISLTNKGLSFDVELEAASEEDRESFFSVSSVSVDVSDLDYSISKNKSWLLYFGQSTVGGLIRRSLKSSLEAQITTMLRDADLELFALQNRAIAATNAKPTALNFVKAVFSPSLFSGSSTSKVTQKGVVKHGRRGEYLLAIGIADQLFPGRAGPSDAHAKRTGALNKLKEFKGNAESAIDAAKYKGTDVAIGGERTVNKLGLTVKQTARQEAKREGWKSDLFDI